MDHFAAGASFSMHITGTQYIILTEARCHNRARRGDCAGSDITGAKCSPYTASWVYNTWDYYKLLETIPADKAYIPLSQSECPLVKKS
jgi:hypothetical protein